MLNSASVEGYVTKKIWEYDGDQFFRLAMYRDPDRPRKRNPQESEGKRDQPDYATVRVPATLSDRIKPGQRVQVHGWLESQVQRRTLAEFLATAKGPALDLDQEKAQEISTAMDYTRIVADRIVPMPHSERKGKKKRTN